MLYLAMRTKPVTATLLGMGILLCGLGRDICLAQALPTDIVPSQNDQATGEEERFVHPKELVAEALGDPPMAKALGTNRLWVDRQQQRVYLDGYVTMREGPLEMFACPTGTKEHESVVATIAQSKEVHAALLAVGAKSGTPVAFLPNFVPATGQRIRVWVCYWDQDNQFHAVDARSWIRNESTNEELQEDWVFGGSGFWKDPRDNQEYYRADGGDMICVSNFTTAMMDLPIASSAEASQLLYVPFTERIPARGTPVRIVLVPIPLPRDRPATTRVDANTPPTKEVLPRNK